MPTSSPSWFVQWNNSQGGDWSTSSDWSQYQNGQWIAGVTPGADDAVTIAGFGNITYNTTATIWSLAEVYGTNTTLDMNGGSLTIDNSSSSLWINIAAGASLVAAAGATVSFTGAANGTLAGDGAFEFSGSIGSGANFTVASLTLGTVTLDTDLNYGGAFTLLGGLINLNGHTLTLSGASNVLGGTLNGPGTVKITGTYNGSLVDWTGGNPPNSIGETIEDAGSMTVTSSFGPFGRLLVDQGATYTFGADGAGTNTGVTNNGVIIGNAAGGTCGISSSAESSVNNGLLEAEAGTLSINGAVTGSGSALITNGATLSFRGDFQQNVVFNGAGSLGLWVQPYSGSITDFQSGDTINQWVGASTDTFSYTVSGDTATFTIFEGSGTVRETFTAVNSQGPYAATGAFTFSTNNNIDTITAQQTICFMAGTMIRTPQGETSVEMLKTGDLVLTTEGVATPVAWLGRQTVSRRFADPLRSLPIRVMAGALGENVPARDLLVSPDHALLIDDVLIHAGALVNGTSISRETRVPETFVYFHVELENHSLILAENAPAETFIDNVNRLAFDNWAEHEALYPDGKPMGEMPYPRAKAQRQVPLRVRAALDQRASIIGAANGCAVA